MSHPYYLPIKYGPVSVGKPLTNKMGYNFGYGRTITVMYSCDQLDHSGTVLSEEKILVVKDWILEEWEDKVILDSNHSYLSMFETLQELGGVDIAIIPDQYNSDLKSCCKYLYDKLNQLVQLGSRGRVWIVEIEIIEHRESFGFKTERYFSAHK